MPTTIVTGRDIVFTLATVNYDAQTTAVTLVMRQSLLPIKH
jgi:hypothetical protein